MQLVSDSNRMDARPARPRHVLHVPHDGLLHWKFGIRAGSAGGAFLALLGTVPFIYMSKFGMVPVLLAASLLVRGAGLDAIAIPSVTAAYASVKKQDLPMATTSLNILQRLGGPTLTMLCATFLAWKLQAVATSAVNAHAFTATFSLVSLLQALSASLPSCFPSLSSPNRNEHRRSQAACRDLRPLPSPKWMPILAVEGRVPPPSASAERA
jgi:hypothetical protein